MQRLLLLLLLTLVMMLGCESKQQSTSAEDSKPPSFSTAEEAAADAKSDLLAIMRTRKNFNLGLDENAIEKSQPAKPVKHFQITFDQLLSAEANTTTIATLAGNELATVVPLVANNNVVTIVGVGKEAEGWRVASLIDKSISDELNVLWHAMPDSSRGEITIYDLPHTSVKVYAVKEGGAEGTSRLFTNYRGFNIQQAVPAEQLLVVLKRDAAEHQRRLANRPGGEMIFH